MWKLPCQIVLVASLAAACGSDDDGVEEAGARAGETAAPDPDPPDAGPPDAAPADAAPGAEFPATESGLSELVATLRDRAVEEDRARAHPLAESLRLPDPAAFFTRHFGDELGAAIAEDYAAAGARIAELVPLLRELYEDGRTEIVVDAFDEASERAVGYQAAALERMVEPTTLYSVRLVEEGEERGFHLWSFVHDGDRFRWAGKMRAVAPEPEVPELPEEVPEGVADELEGELPEGLSPEGIAELAEELAGGSRHPQDVGLPDLLELPEDARRAAED